MEQQRIIVLAKDLRKGDILANTNEEVTVAPFRGINTPTGRIELMVNGWHKIWNARTEIAIKPRTI